ncbi:glycosyltransferase family protein [Aureivirga sp. CE67]|uniref:glycosyltransferase family protein n=1 Tax=Aureivirga sp. CE67 TaxID=1788983 RepID=UPI0018CA8830|nr:glycosyltransferase family protein [Aureivirga sp. CE67]
MKILYAIQATGNGHVSRAKEIVPAFLKRINMDILLSGIQTEVKAPFDVKYHYKGLSWIFGKQGGVDLYQTFKRNSIPRFIKEIRNCPVENYDLVINDFEPITAWACRIKKVPSISLSHHCALLSEKVPQPNFKDFLGKMMLKYYAPTKTHYGFHFEKYDNHIHHPIIRSGIRECNNTVNNHYTVYLPSYSDKNIIETLSEFQKINWQVFSKHSDQTYQYKNIKIHPIEGKLFEESITSCEGIICGAGFETPAEAIYLKKKLLVIPMKNQYEQHYNAESLRKIGVPVLDKLCLNHSEIIRNWINSPQQLDVNYTDDTQNIVDSILEKHVFTK